MYFHASVSSSEDGCKYNTCLLGSPELELKLIDDRWPKGSAPLPSTQNFTGNVSA